MRRFVRLPWCGNEGHGPADRVRDHATNGKAIFASKPWCHSRHETGQVGVSRSESAWLHEGPVALKRRLFGRPGRFLVRADAGAVEKGHPKLHALLLDQRQQPFPDPEPRPTDEGSCRHPPWPEFGRHRAPLGAVVMPPRNGADRAPQMSKGHLCGRANCLDQRFQHRPLRIRQHRAHLAKKRDNA